MIRQLEALTTIMEQTTDATGVQALMAQAAMIQRANLESVSEECDRADVYRRYAVLETIYDRLTTSA
jgi:uncharacterized membrane protein